MIGHVHIGVRQCFRRGFFISSRKACGVDGGLCLALSSSRHFCARDLPGRASLPDVGPMC